MEIITEINNNGRPTNLVIDASGIFYRTIYSMVEDLEKTAYQDLNMFKSAVIEYILNIKKMYNNPKIVLCYDKKKEGKYWRHNIYDGYKEHRKKAPSRIPKDILFKAFTSLLNDIEENFPWLVCGVEGCEADDIVAVYVKEHANENNVIIANDKDYIMLRINPNVQIMNLFEKKFVEGDPLRFKFEHVISGDTVDNIRNIFSSLEHNGTRQTPVTKKKLEEMFSCFRDEGMESFVKKYLNTDILKKRFSENRRLIDFDMIPKKVLEQIVQEINTKQIKGSYNNARKYFINNRMLTLIDMTLNGI